MNIKLNARMIALTLALMLVVTLLVSIAVLHATHSVPWHTLVSSPYFPNHGH